MCVLVDDGETGTAYFDDLSFQKCRRPPIRFLVSAAYRDTVTDGDVEFRLVSNMTDADIAERGLRGTVLMPDANSRRRQRMVSVPDPKEGVWNFSLDLTGMPYGELPTPSQIPLGHTAFVGWFCCSFISSISSSIPRLAVAVHRGTIATRSVRPGTPGRRPTT